MMALACLVVFGLACSQNDQPADPTTDNSTLTAAATPSTETQEAPKITAPTPTPTPAPKIRLGGDDKAPINLKLPEPVFEGTPTELDLPNLDPKTGRRRPAFMAPAGAANIALGKPVIASAAPVLGEPNQLTDGNKEANPANLVNLPAGMQHIQIDLEKTSTLYAIVFWHFHQAPRVYFDVVVQVSDDPEFEKDVTTLYNNDHDNTSGHGVGKNFEYVETNEGRLVDAKSVKARYVRIWTNGSTSNKMNHFIEVEVHGAPTG